MPARVQDACTPPSHVGEVLFSRNSASLGNLGRSGVQERRPRKTTTETNAVPHRYRFRHRGHRLRAGRRRRGPPEGPGVGGLQDDVQEDVRVPGGRARAPLPLRGLQAACRPPQRGEQEGRQRVRNQLVLGPVRISSKSAPCPAAAILVDHAQACSPLSVPPGLPPSNHPHCLDSSVHALTIAASPTR